jgi:hypothetical protein
MKHLAIYFLFIVTVLFWGCGKGDDFEYPIDTDFNGKFAYSSLGSGSEIFVFSSLGVEQITDGCSGSGCEREYPKWIYPGDKILYHFKGGNPGFAVMNDDGSNRKQFLADYPGESHLDCDVSKDGKYFARFEKDTVGIYEFQGDTLVIIDSFSWPQESALSASSGFITFSPNNELILVNDRTSYGLSLGIHHIGQPGIITYSQTQQSSLGDANFSYQSDKIVFQYDGEIWVIQSDGQNPEKVIRTKDHYEAFPVWSPVEDVIAFSRSRYKHPNDPRELVLFDFASRMEHVILSTENITSFVNIRWSLDGQQISFATFDEPNKGTFVINIDGTGLKRISTASFEDWFTE